MEMANGQSALIANRPKEGERKTEEANTDCTLVTHNKMICFKMSVQAVHGCEDIWDQRSPITRQPALLICLQKQMLPQKYSETKWRPNTFKRLKTASEKEATESRHSEWEYKPRIFQGGALQNSYRFTLRYNVIKKCSNKILIWSRIYVNDT